MTKEIKCKRCNQVRVRISGDFGMKISDLCYWCSLGARMKEKETEK